VSVKSRQALIVLVLVIDLLADHRSTAEREDEWELAAQLALTLTLIRQPGISRSNRSGPAGE
jgi:uncharacterized membrane protein